MQTENGREADGGSPTGRTTSAAVEAVAFLTRSEHRVRVLELLEDGARSRETLLEGTGVSRVTLSRILGDLEERGWIRKTGGEYETTGFGRLVYEDVARLLGTVSLGEAYPDVVERLPTEFLDFDVRHLAEGELVAEERADPLAATRVVADAVREADTVRAVVGTFTCLPMYAYAEAMHAGSAPDTEVVFGTHASAVGREDPSLATRAREIEANAESRVYYSVDEGIPCNVDLIDDETVYLSIPREHGGFDVIESHHPAVREWARERFRQAKDRATPFVAERVAACD